MRVYAIEVSGICNLRCPWCAMSSGTRQRGLMSSDVVDRAIEIVSACGAHDPLFLHMFGEPALHPEFPDIAARFAHVAPISFSTNCAAVDANFVERLSGISIKWITLSPWLPLDVERVAGLLRNAGINYTVPSGVVHNWADQAQEGPRTLNCGVCPFFAEGLFVIRWDGSYATCCITDHAGDAIGNVFIDPPPSEPIQTAVCGSCHHKVPIHASAI